MQVFFFLWFYTAYFPKFCGKYLTARIHVHFKDGVKTCVSHGKGPPQLKSMESLSLTWKGMNELPVNKGNS